MLDKSDIELWSDNNTKWFDPSNIQIASKIIKLFYPICKFVNYRVSDSGVIEIRINIKLSKGNSIPYNYIEVTDSIWDAYPLLILQIQSNNYNYITINRVSALGIVMKRKLYHLDFNIEESLKEYLKDWGIIIK